MEDYVEKMKRVIETVEKESSWVAFYQGIKVESGKNNYSCGQAKSQANFHLNRYRDVSPYDHSRVVLQNGPCDYINASLVKVEKAGRNYILTQGALQHTSGHFWLMVWEQKSKGILMLNKVIEKNQEKCHQYWPSGMENGQSKAMDFDDVRLRVHLLSEDTYRNFITRRLEIEDMSTGNRREVLQFHYTTWPDFGVPSSPRAFLHFLQIVRDADVLSSKFGPAVVHCSAGIGRSGTFCLVDSCLLMMEKGLEVNVKEVLLEMRKYRLGLIQTPDQLRFSYLAILEGCHQLSNGNKKFLEDNTEGNGITEEDLIPLPPRRAASLSPVEGYVRLIAERPLPPVPDSSSGDDTSESEADLIDEDDEDEDEDGETTSTSYGLLDHVRDQTPLSSERKSSKSSVSEVENLHEDSQRTSEASVNPSISVEEDQTTTQHNTNGLDGNELRRRLKSEATREKIREIRAKQKESEVRQGLYRSLRQNRYVLCALGVSAVAIYLYTRSSSST